MTLYDSQFNPRECKLLAELHLVGFTELDASTIARMESLL